MSVLWVAVGAALGAPIRYLIDRAIATRHDSLFPWGTLTVNVLGSLLLGLLTGLATGPTLMATVGTGFCGALTTYSTFSYETLRLAVDGARHYALANIAAHLVAGLAAAASGFTVAHVLVG